MTKGLYEWFFRPCTATFARFSLMHKVFTLCSRLTLPVEVVCWEVAVAATDHMRADCRANYALLLRRP
jgi:hypothetical protein